MVTPRASTPHRPPVGSRVAVPPQARARSRSSARSRAFCVSAAARSNSPRASSRRPSFARRSPRTLGSRWYARERRLVHERVDELQAGGRPERHRHRDRAVQLHDRRRRELGQRVVERGDARPVGLRRRCARGRGTRRSRPGARTGRARRRAPRRARAPRARGGSRSWSQRARSWSSSRIGSPRGPDARARARRLQLHQRDEAVDLRLAAGRAPRGCARAAARPRRAPAASSRRRRRGVALVEHEVDDLEHRREPRRAARRRAAPRTGRAPRRASAWRARCAGRPSAPGRGTPARSRRSSARRAGAA